jgi:hypothetical protein
LRSSRHFFAELAVKNLDRKDREGLSKIADMAGRRDVIVSRERLGSRLTSSCQI